MIMMKIIEYFTSDNQEHWLKEIRKSDWGAGQYLYTLLKEGKLKELVGRTALVPMLIEEETQKLVSFCTFAPLDDIQPTALSPWIGFVYTFPEYWGHHYIGRLLAYAESLATVMGKEYVYISTGETGLYEKYGYEFFDFLQNSIVVFKVHRRHENILYRHMRLPCLVQSFNCKRRLQHHVIPFFRCVVFVVSFAEHAEIYNGVVCKMSRIFHVCVGAANHTFARCWIEGRKQQRNALSQLAHFVEKHFLRIGASFDESNSLFSQMVEILALSAWAYSARKKLSHLVSHRL